MRVLVAEGETATSPLLEETIARLGHECLVARDASSASEVMRTADIDLLFTEWRTSGVEGISRCRRARESMTPRDTYIVVVGRLEPDQILESLDAGADDCIATPVDVVEVQACVAAAQRAGAGAGAGRE